MEIAPLLHPLESAHAVCDYPAEGNVRDGVSYGDSTFTGTLVLPQESDVLVGITYGSGGTEFTGTLECDSPPSPTPPFPGAYPFAAIAASIRSRVSTSLSIPEAYVNLVANDRYKVTETEPLFVYIRVYGPGQPQDPALAFTNSGAGRGMRPVARRVRCYIYTRAGEDIYGIDNVALLGADPSLTFASGSVPGQFIAEEMVFNALDDYLPLAANGSGLTLGPLHPLDSMSGPAERKPENEEGLIRSYLDFEAIYISCIDPTEPAP